jgi:integrase
MAYKRKRGDTWTYVIKRKGVFEKPLALTFASEAEGDEYCRKLEALLDRGIVPTEFVSQTGTRTLADLIKLYEREHPVKQKDSEVLRTVIAVRGSANLVEIDAGWVDVWIAEMKHTHKYKPATIRAKIGAVARCCDWGVRKKILSLPDAPFRSLPNGYSQYNEKDASLAGDKLEDTERDRRLEGDEEANIRRVIAAGVVPRKFRNLKLDHVDQLLLMFELALETAMRLRETYTLSVSQVDLDKRTIFLDKTKNGDKRQVPLSSVATRVLKKHLTQIKDDKLFVWWDGSLEPRNLKRTTDKVSKLFAAIFGAAGCPDLTYHDLRHEATSRLFERTSLSTEEIMKITGHRSHRMMMRYLKLRGSNLASKLW